MTSVDHLESLLELCQAPDSSTISALLPKALGACGYHGSFTILTGSANTDAAQVYQTTFSGLQQGDEVTHTGAPANDPNDETNNNVQYFDTPQVICRNDGDIRAHTVLPLRAVNETYGNLLLHEALPTSTATSVNAIELLAKHFGLALYRNQLNEERQRRHLLDAAKLTSVTRTGQVLRELDIDRVLAGLMELAITTVGAEVGCIAVADEESGVVSVRTEWGFTGDMLESLILQDGRALADVVALEHVISISQTPQDFADFRPAPVLELLSTLLVLPLATRKQFAGCLVVANASGIEASDIELLSIVTELSSTAIDNAMLHHAALEKQALVQQLEIAGTIQKDLLPPTAPVLPGVSISGLNIPCDESGGDYFDYFVVGDSRAGFVLGDATGHGIGAALIATTARASLRAMLGARPKLNIDMAGVLAELNELIEHDFNDDKFITLFFGIFDPATGQLEYASAGHDPPMMIYRAQQDQFIYLESTGLPLGMFNGSEYLQCQTDNLQCGDILLLMSDGIDEALNPDNEQFGKDRVIDFVRTHKLLTPGELVKQLTEEVFRFSRDAAQNDDITLVCLKVDEN